MEKRTPFLSALMLLLVVVLALLSPSCNPVIPPTEIVPTKEPDVQLHFVGQRTSDAHDELIGYLLDQCGVTYELIEAVEYWPMLEARFAAGDPLDIIQVDAAHFPAYAARGSLLPVDDPAGSALDEFFEPLVRAFTFKDVPYGVPRDSDALVLLYNAERFEEAGLDYPHDDWGWGELKEFAWVLTEATGMAGFSVLAEPYYFYPFVLQAGGRFMADDFSDTWIDQGEAIDAGYFYTEARVEGWAITPEDSGAGWYGEAFARGDVAMVLGGTWMQSYLSEEFPDLAYGAVHVPAGPYGKVTVAFATAYAVSVNSAAPEAAWKAIDCLTNLDAQVLMLDSGVALPSRRYLEDHPYITDNPIARAVYSSLEFASPYGWGPYHYEVDEQIREALRRVYYEGWLVEDSFAVAAEEIRGIIWQ